MAIDNLSLSPVRLAAPTPGTAQPAANNTAAPTIGSDSLTLSAPVSLLANANSVAANNTVKTASITTADGGDYTVKPGDTLSGIAQDKLGDATRWPEIYQGNQDQIDDPNLIYPGQKLTLPGAKPAPAPAEEPADELTDLEPIDLTPEPASTTPAPAPKPLPKPIPRDFPPYGPTRCFPHPQGPRPQGPRPSFPQQPSNRTDVLRQKLELLKMEQQVVQLELQLDRMLGKLDAPQPTRRFGGAVS